MTESGYSGVFNSLIDRNFCRLHCRSIGGLRGFRHGQVGRTNQQKRRRKTGKIKYDKWKKDNKVHSAIKAREERKKKVDPRESEGSDTMWEK